MVDPIGATGASKIDVNQWRKLTPAEIIDAETRGEEVPPEIITWAIQIMAYEKIPDNVTYKQVDGDIGIKALQKLDIPEEEEEPPTPQPDNATPPADAPNPDAVDGVNKPEKTPPKPTDQPNIFANLPETPPQEPPTEDDTPPELLGLADTDITTDPETIRKRREKRGLPPL